MSGAWRVTFNMESRVESENYNISHLYLNGYKLEGTMHKTYSKSGEVKSTSGRVVTIEASAGDTIELRTDPNQGSYYYINFCAEYITKI